MCHSSSGPQQQQPGAASELQSIPNQFLELVPDHPACAEALSIAKRLLRPSIFNHSLRVYLYALKGLQLAANPALLSASSMDQSVLFVSCILHDIGSADALAADPQRFEVAAADLAAALLSRNGFNTVDTRESWLAIALHTSPHIAEGAGGAIRLVRLAVLADFGSVSDALRPFLTKAYMEEVEGLLPRLGIENELGDAVVRQARTTRSKAPGGSWPGDLLRAAEESPGWEGVNKSF
ncbi:hypothetical protein AURDEDRAFT_126589 [Auricularia subglabra TFB-10046 SS5]|nr:hypothetical protein AURDEDRAFT_126589 [Auricularia subglabra TFB-10046 SS5]